MAETDFDWEELVDVITTFFNNQMNLASGRLMETIESVLSDLNPERYARALEEVTQLIQAMSQEDMQR